jgi:hypothetical protein
MRMNFYKYFYFYFYLIIFIFNHLVQKHAFLNLAEFLLLGQNLQKRDFALKSKKRDFCGFSPFAQKHDFAAFFHFQHILLKNSFLCNFHQKHAFSHF